MLAAMPRERPSDRKDNMKIRNINAIVAAATAAATFALVPGSASALTPAVTPPAGDYTINIPAELTPCGSLTVGVHDGERYTTFFNKDGSVRVIGVNGTLIIHVQSDVTGRSIDLNVSGPGQLFPNGDIVLTGAMLLFAPHTLAFVHGRAVIQGADVDAAQITGTRVDLCPILVG